MSMKEEWNVLVSRQMKTVGITIVKLAERMGVSKSTIGHWLKKERNPNLEDIAKMLYLVGIDSVTLYSDGLVSLKESYSLSKIEGVEVKWIMPLGFNQESDHCPLQAVSEKQYVDFRSTDPTAYAVQVKGDGLKPRIDNSEYLIVEPNHRKVQLYDEVLVTLHNGDSFVRIFVAAPTEPDEPYAFIDLNKGFASKEEAYTDEQIKSIHYIAGIVKKNRLVK